MPLLLIMVWGYSAYMDIYPSLNTSVGKNVAKGEELIGHSGISGLAGGDHLHFSIIVGGQFVNPQEWWDPHWIKDNITIDNKCL